MGAIIERKRKDGKTAYLAQINLQKNGVLLLRENKTHATRREAAGWMARREAEALEDAKATATDGPTLAEVIDRYSSASRRKLGRTKVQVLRSIKAMPIASKRCGRIGSPELIAMASELGQRMAPQTVQNYLSHLSAVFAIARPAWGLPLDVQAMKDAFTVGKRLGITGKSKARNRRPSIEELNLILATFTKRRKARPHIVPMADIVLFAIFSTRRQEEITRLRWADYEPQHGRILVRDLKHPEEKDGNHQWCDLPPEAMAVIDRQPRKAPEIFPYTTDALSANFARCCMDVKINTKETPAENRLRFHDLRHDGVSRLFELDWQIPRVATVSGHRNWQSMQRYTHIKQRGDKYAGWAWLPKAKKKPAD